MYIDIIRLYTGTAYISLLTMQNAGYVLEMLLYQLETILVVIITFRLLLLMRLFLHLLTGVLSFNSHKANLFLGFRGTCDAIFGPNLIRDFPLLLIWLALSIHKLNQKVLQLHETNNQVRVLILRKVSIFLEL